MPQAAAALSVGSALIHASVIGVHFREYWLFGVLFAFVAPLQLVWAELVRRAPDHRRLLLAGLAGNLAVATIWLLSRTAGLPFGPHPGVPEAVGLKDVVATTAELLCALLVFLALMGETVRQLVAAGWTVAAVSAVVAFLPGGH